MARPTGMLTFLFSDVEGSTRLLMKLGDGYAAAHGDHQRIVRDGIATHAGMEVSTEGDSFFVVFTNGTDAMAAAAEIQRSLAAHAWPASGEFRVRIGLHTGQAVLAGDDYVGLDVNRAARIANAANGGQTVLSDAVRAAAPSPLEGVSLRDLGRHRLKDVGVERLWQLDVAGLPTAFGSLRSLEAHPTNLPVERTPFVGRETESRALADLVLASPLVTVTGPGGIGKSRLAVAVARSLIERFPDGVFYVDLAPHERFESMLSELAMVSDTRLPAGDDQVDAFVERFAGRSALLVFDTADRLSGFGILASRLVEACTELRIMVTARAPLHLGAEREFPLSTFDLPPSRGASVETIAASPAVQLFVRRAQAVRPDLVLSPENGSTIASIVSRLDGLPLAIELAAARIRVFTPEALLARLERRLPILRGGAVDAPERQRTIEATIAWSYELLEPDERTMLTRLSVFADAFDLEGALAVTADAADGAGTTDPVVVLERLVDRSLVSTVSGEESTDFRLLGIIREFAADELGTGRDAIRARERHARYVLAVAESSTEEIDGPGERRALERLGRSADDVRAVLERTLDAGVDAPADEDHIALRLTSAMSRAWYLQGRTREGSDYLERALAADPDAPVGLRANALHMSGVLHDERRETARAMEQLDASLELLRAIGDARRIARELNSVGVVARNAGDTERAAALLEESLAMRRALADLPGVATSLTNLGVVAIDRGRYDEAQSLLEEAVGLDRASGASGVVAYSSNLLGTVLVRTGRRAEALDLLRPALETFAELGDADGVAECLERLGEAVLTQDPARAARLVYAAGAIRRQHDVPLRAPDEAAAERLMLAVDAALETEALAEARTEAAVMDLEAAVAYALASTTL
jgi:predicted ATPase/class 3 adenylate cyclase